MPLEYSGHVHVSRASRKEELRAILGNPTPLGVMGFILSLTPLACDLMEWRGAGGFGAATVGTAYFFGGLLMILAAVLEFILGNTFIFVVFSSYAAFWLSLAATLTPFYAAYTAYEPSDPTNPGFNNSYDFQTLAFFEVFMGLLCFIYLICSIRTNICFVVIFLALTLGFSFLAGTSWQLANGNADLSRSLKKVGWYFLLVQMLASVDFPFTLPVGDLSRIVRGASDKSAKAV
ncbi:GPR1/FUN34/yaaH family-domain-containing protein [Aspergillus pseudonomiae]|uniref:GPR1/FUN34/yaaH family-domain-containing protein n=1 Tax=Aspergillus pseudonomiae TaxID=1506151 RepID=A0A5N7DPE7_9EURO|nr:GPR1/FUN34/yaaH family-domain-containing protein [Aspergillus pseudonomiae]KAE8407348.1 GPR1/FUN34/yaaH family-domain-containing protein [Aspergillus pseudonomiae]